MCAVQIDPLRVFESYLRFSMNVMQQNMMFYINGPLIVQTHPAWQERQLVLGALVGLVPLLDTVGCTGCALHASEQPQW